MPRFYTDTHGTLYPEYPDDYWRKDRYPTSKRDPMKSHDKPIELFFNSVAVDPTQEHEWQAPLLHVTLRFTSGQRVYYDDITEVHWRYPRQGEPRVALESDIRASGSTWPISEVLSLAVIEIDTPELEADGE